MAKPLPPTDDPLKLGEFLCFAIYSAEHAFNRAYAPLLGALGLTYPQYLAMVTLWRGDDQTVGQLGERLQLESSTLTPLLKRLEAMGHVKRSRDPADERVVRVRLTDEGRALRERAVDVPRCIAEATGLDAETAGRMLADITRVRDALTRHLEKAG